MYKSATAGVAGVDFPPGVGKLAPFAPWGPVIDGKAAGMPELPLNAIAEGRHVDVPLLIGTNADEGSIFLPLLPFFAGLSFPLKAGAFETLLHYFFDPDVHSGEISDVSSVLAAYPSSDFGINFAFFFFLIRQITSSHF